MCVKLGDANFQSCSERGSFSNWGLNEQIKKFHVKPVISRKRSEIGPRSGLLLNTDRKCHTPFQIT